MQKKILVIEDNTDVRENLAEILSLSNYKVSTAENGKKGVESALKESPDLILCDVMMPELDGFGVLHILSKNPLTANIPFVFLTAKTEKDDFRKGMNLGADDYITKPFDDVELLEAIERRIAKHSHLTQPSDAMTPTHSAWVDEKKGYETVKNLFLESENRLYKKKATIYKEGSYPRHLFYVKSGKVKIFKTNEFGKDLIIAVKSEGDFIGYEALLGQTVYHENSDVLEDAELHLLTKEAFYELLNQNHNVCSYFIKMLAGNLTLQENHLVNLAYNSVRKRVANALLELEVQYKCSKFEISREDFANLVGTAKETVIRTLSDMKDEKLVSLEGNSITIINSEKLKKMFN